MNKKLNSTIAKVYIRCTKCKRTEEINTSKVELYTMEMRKKYKCWRCKK